VRERLRILLSGMVAGDPGQGGAAWAVLQYFHGLRDLGHDVALVEPLRDRGTGDGPDSRAVDYFWSLGLPADRSALLLPASSRPVGMPYEEIIDFATGADLLLNISGMLADERILSEIPTRAFLDLDPGFNQVWSLGGEDMGFGRHTHFVTVGQLLGAAGCRVPACGLDWIKTLPPVVLDRWPAAAAPASDAFTTIGHWRSYGSTEYEGVEYGQRAHSLRKLIELPQQAPGDFELALGIHPDEVDDLLALHRHGWLLVEPDRVAGTPDLYSHYIRRSFAELGVAKSGYVNSRSGWFSDRSACYLASGRPVVAQETGFGEVLPLGEGLLSFATVAEAAAAVEAVRSRPGVHRARARELAEDLFDARKVLSKLLAELASSPPAPSPSSRRSS
jgi:hypothetical protein